MSHNGLRLCSTLNTKITYKKKKEKISGTYTETSTGEFFLTFATWFP